MSAARNTISRCLVLFVLLAILGLQANSVAAAKEPETGIDRIPEVGSSISHEHEAQSVKNWDWSIWPGPTYRSPKEKFTARFQGRILCDFGTLRDQKSVGSTDGWETNLRILRVGLAGTIGRTIGYQVNLSIDNGDFNVQDAFLQYSDRKTGPFGPANSKSQIHSKGSPVPWQYPWWKGLVSLMPLASNAPSVLVRDTWVKIGTRGSVFSMGQTSTKILAKRNTSHLHGSPSIQRLVLSAVFTWLRHIVIANSASTMKSPASNIARALILSLSTKLCGYWRARPAFQRPAFHF